MGGCGRLGHLSDFLHVDLGGNLLINILDGPRVFLGKSGTVGPDEKTKGVIRQKVGVTFDVHNICYRCQFQTHDQSKQSYGR